MLKIVALAVAIVTTVTPALTEEQINTVSDETLSIGDWGKVLNQAVFACRLPGDLQTHGSLMIQMNTLQIAKGEPVKASPDGACWPLVAGTDVQFVRTAEGNNDVICVRRRDEQDCSWTFKLGIDGVSGPATGVLAATLSPHGTLVSFAAMSEGPMSINPLDVIFKPLTMRGFWLGHPEIATKIGPAIVQAAAMIASGRVHIPVAATYPISSIKQAVAHAQRGGKILLDVAGSST